MVPALASGTLFFKVLSVVPEPSGDGVVAIYLTQHGDLTYECGEMAWRAQGTQNQLLRHDRVFFEPEMLRDPRAAQKLRAMGCLGA